MQPIDEAETIPPRIGVATRSMTKSINTSRTAAIKDTADLGNASVSMNARTQRKNPIVQRDIHQTV